MIAHILNAQGEILNTIVVRTLADWPMAVDAAIGGTIGDSVIGGKLVVKATQAAPVEVPESVPKLNARLVLIRAGYWDDVLAFAATLPEGDMVNGFPRAEALAYIQDAQTWRRDNPLVAAWSAARGKSSAELDHLFIAAGALNV